MHKLSYFLTATNISLMLVGLAVASFFVPRIQLDLTRNSLFSVSPSTVKYIKDLKDVVRIDVYMSSELPTEIKPLSDNLKVILNNLAKVNPSRFIVRYFDPNESQDTLETAKKEGILPLQFNSIKNDKIEIQNGYFGMVIGFGNKKDILPVAGDIGNLEYYIVSAINKITQAEKAKVLLASGNGEWGQDQVSIFQRFLSSEYTVVPVELNKEKQLDTSAKLLLINGPKGKYNKSAIDLIKKWVDVDKKNLIVWMDQILVTDSLGSSFTKTDLEPLLVEYGFNFDQKYLIDEESGVASFATKNGNFNLKYPFWPKIDLNGINRTHPSVSSLSSATFPWTTVIKSDEKIVSLMSSRPTSFLTEIGIELNPLATKEIPMSGEQQASIVAAISKNSNRVIVVSDSDFIRDQFVVNNQQNLALGMNLVDYSAANENLIQIRSKQLYSAPIKELPERQKSIIKIVGIFLPILFLSLTYLLFFLVRKYINNRVGLNAKKEQ